MKAVRKNDWLQRADLAQDKAKPLRQRMAVPRPGALSPARVARMEDDPITIKHRRISVGAPVHGHAPTQLETAKIEYLKG